MANIEKTFQFIPGGTTRILSETEAATELMLIFGRTRLAALDNAKPEGGDNG